MFLNNSMIDKINYNILNKNESQIFSGCIKAHKDVQSKTLDGIIDIYNMFPDDN